MKYKKKLFEFTISDSFNYSKQWIKQEANQIAIENITMTDYKISAIHILKIKFKGNTKIYFITVFGKRINK